MMRRLILALSCLFVLNLANAQNEIEDVIVEVYYVSDANDETDTDGGFLEQGSKTYRIFIDLAPNASLVSLYADASHKFRVASTEVIFNNEDRGEALGFDIPGNRLDDNTVALDSWLTLGAASDDHTGVLKTLDPDSSIIGGINNDGGSQSIAGGLLVNDDALAGIPIDSLDGLVADTNAVPAGFFAGGTDPDTSSVLLDMNTDTLFQSFDMNWSAPSGVKGDSTNNIVLVGQITTKGELMFNMNIQVMKDDGTIIDYIWGGQTTNDEVINGLLNFPPACGCTDPAYLEFDPQAGCDDGSCMTLIAFGCLDTLACNYDPTANFNVQALCCWGPDSCNGLDPQVVCPGVGIDDIDSPETLSVFPNPFNDRFTIHAPNRAGDCFEARLSDLTGRIVRNERICFDANATFTFALSELNDGMYTLTLSEGVRYRSVRLIKGR